MKTYNCITEGILYGEFSLFEINTDNERKRLIEIHLWGGANRNFVILYCRATKRINFGNRWSNIVPEGMIKTMKKNTKNGGGLYQKLSGIYGMSNKLN